MSYRQINIIEEEADVEKGRKQRKIDETQLTLAKLLDDELPRNTKVRVSSVPSIL